MLLISIGILAIVTFYTDIYVDLLFYVIITCIKSPDYI